MIHHVKRQKRAFAPPAAEPPLQIVPEDAGKQKPASRKWNRIGSALMLALAAVVMIVALRDTSLAEVWQAVREVDPVWLGLSVAAALGSALLFGLALHIALRTLYGKPLSLSRSLGFGFVGQYYTSITPAGAAGQPMQLFYMCAYGVEFSYASLSLLLVNAAHQIVVLLIPAALFPFRAGLVLDNLGAFLWLLLFGTIVNIALILFLVLAMFSQSFAARIVGWIIGLLSRLRIVKDRAAAEARVEKQIRLYKHGAAALKAHPWLLVAELIAYILLLGLQFVIPYFIYRAFGLSGYGLVDFIALQSVLFLAVCFLPLPGSTGASESGFVRIFRVLFQSVLIVPAMLLSRFVSFYLILAVSGIVSLGMQLGLSRRRKRLAAREAAASSAAASTVPPAPPAS